MKVKQFKAGLEKLALQLDGLGRGDLEQELDKLIQLLDGHETLSVDEFCHRAKACLGAKTAEDTPANSKMAGKRTGRRAGNDLRQVVVEAYIEQLKAAHGQDAAFLDTIEKIGADKSVRIKELKAIAKGFLGFQPVAKKRADLISEIVTKRAQDLRTAHKRKILSQW